MKISSNIIANIVVGKMNKANNSAAIAMERLSSGLKINSAKDNPAGLAVANKLNVQVKGLDQAASNVMNGISMIQTAEGAMNEVHAMLCRIKELTVQGENDTYSEQDRGNIQKEIDALIEGIKDIQKRTEFNQINMLQTEEDLIIQIGANASQNMIMSGKEINLDQTIALIDGMNFEDEEKEMVTQVEEAIAMTSTIRGKLGAYQNRLEHTYTSLEINEENTIASLSKIKDADMAEEMTNYTQHNVISQAGIAMLAQANQRPQQVLQLLNK